MVCAETRPTPIRKNRSVKEIIIALFIEASSTVSLIN
jgi:hypothetical protein